MTDQDLVNEINSYVANNKMVSRAELKNKLKTSRQRLEKLEANGLVKLPAKLSKSAGATLGRRKSNTCANWYISRPAPWQVGA